MRWSVSGLRLFLFVSFWVILLPRDARAGDLSGTVVTWPEGTPLAGIAVYAFDPRARYEVVETSPDGEFRFSSLAEGPYRVRAWPEPEEGENRVGAWFGDTYFYCYAPWVDVPEVGEAEAVEIALPEGGILTGLVTARSTGEALAGAEVRLEGLDFYNDYQDIRVMTDEEGRYTAVGLDSAQDAPGDYRVSVTVAGRPRWWHPGSYDPGEAESAEAVRGETRTVDLSVPEGGTLAGQVLLSDGTPAAYAEVDVAGVDFTYSGATASADAEGRFQVSGLAPGMHRVWGYHGEAGSGFLGKAGLGVVNEEDAAEVELPEDGAVTELSWTLLSPAWVTVQILAQGEPLADVVVRVYTASDFISPGPSVVTDEDGRASPQGLGTGEYVLAVSPPSGEGWLGGYFQEEGGAASSSWKPFQTGKEPLTLTMDLEPAAFLEGRVLERETATPLGSLRVYAEGVAGQEGAFLAVSATDGTWSLTALPEGEFLVHAETYVYCEGDPGYATAYADGARSADLSQPLSLIGGQSATTDLILPQDGDGDGMADVWERAWFLDPSDFADASFDGDGDGLWNRDEYLLGTDPWGGVSLVQEGAGCILGGVPTSLPSTLVLLPLLWRLRRRSHSASPPSVHVDGPRGRTLH